MVNATLYKIRRLASVALRGGLLLHEAADQVATDCRGRCLTRFLDARLPVMVAHIIGFVLQNLPALLFVVALLVAAARGRHGPVAERFLSWILLLPIGITGLWAGAFHVFFPATAAKLIGKEKIGTRYVVLAVRTLVNPNDPKDVDAVHALQDAIKVDQTGGTGKV